MRHYIALMAGIAALACAVPARAQDELPPTGAERGPKPNSAMLITGSALFVGPYAASVIVGATSGNDADRNLFIPLVGPFIDIGQRNACSGGCAGSERFIQATLVANAAAQIIGVGLVVASYFVPEKEKTVAETKRVLVVPMGTLGGGGVAAVGKF